MKLVEFKAWFEGFTESLDGPPSAKQWKRIKEQVEAIDGVGITERVYIDRYWPHYPMQATYWPHVLGVGVSSAVSMAGQNAKSAMQASNTFDGTTAMYAAGKAEALAS